MSRQHKVTLVGVLACTLLVFTTNAQQIPQEQNLAFLPAITLQMRNNGLVQTKFAKLYSEENYGIWIALDHKNNALHYKIIQKEDGPTLIDVDTITAQLTNYVKENEATIKSYLSDIINFQTAKQYLTLLKDHFKDTPIPTIGDINAKLLKFGLHPELQGNKNSYAEAEFDKVFQENFFRLENQINIWQKKYNISPQNMQEINHVYQTLQKYIDTHPLNSSHYHNSFSMSFDSFDPTNIDNTVQFEQQKPYTIQFAQIKNLFVRRLNKKPNAIAEYKTTVSAFFYLPPLRECYGNLQQFEQFKDKIKNIDLFLQEHKQDSLLTPDAPEKIKEKANEMISTVIAEIKKLQQRINTEIDKICDKLKNIF